MPNSLGHPDNYIPANPLATPAQIVPEWYFWPFYAILRSFTVDFILPGQAVGRAGDVRLDPAAVLPAVARQVAGALGQLPADVQALLLAAGRSTCWCSATAAAARDRAVQPRCSARSRRLIISCTSWSSCRSSRGSSGRCRCRTRSPRRCCRRSSRKRAAGLGQHDARRPRE